jgi:hypothetical protein
MPGFGRGGILPGPDEPERGPRSRSPGAGRSPRGPGPGRSPPGRAGRSPPGRPSRPGVLGAAGGWLAPPPTPNGLLPTRCVRGPGLGVCFLGGTTAPVCCPPGLVCAGPAWAAAAAGRAGCCGCCGGRIGSITGDVGSGGVWTTGSGAFGRLGPGVLGRGPGPGRVPGAGPDGRAAGCDCVAGWTAAGAWAGASVAGRGGTVGAAATPSATTGAGAATCGRGALSRAPPPDRAGFPLSALGKESRNLRATGASTVEEADFTNSPKSLSLASTSLLVTPSSLASSCTRALPATALLI